MKRILFLTATLLFSFQSVYAQIPGDKNTWLQAHFHINDTSYFLFDSAFFPETQPQSVTVAGSFNGWSSDASEYQLQKKSNTQWIFAIPNPNATVIPPQSQFRFVVNGEQWMEPHCDALNKNDGNYVFLPDFVPARLRAEFKNSRAIVAIIEGFERPLDPAAYLITDAEGNQIPVAAVLPNTASLTLIKPGQELDKRRVYWLEIPALGHKAWISYDGWFRDLYSNKELGANISEDGNRTDFRLFAPRADSIILCLYPGKDDAEPQRRIAMNMDSDGVWEAKFQENLFKTWYDFEIYGPDEPGNHYYPQIGIRMRDPYARVSDDTWGKSRVWTKTTPATPLKNGIPAMESVIAYEVHVQDFTDKLPVDKTLQGTLPAMTKRGLKNSIGQKIGFDYLVDLGINTVHLMPVQEFLHYKDDEWQEAFKDDPFMIENGINMENYQWGYRTTFAFAVESRFRKKDSEHGSEREQFRDLVQAFHDQGIAVIIDIVPNHTGENMELEYNYYFNWNGIDKVYHYRTRDLEHIGEYGNEVKTENRPMVQRWLIDQCLHFINEFGIDGFRIDLAGQIDEQTLIAIKKALGPDIIVYGEPWIGSFDPDFENNPDWDWYKVDSPITFFQDDARNAFKGSVFTVEFTPESRGWPGGDFSIRDNVITALQNYFPEEKTPLSGINYLDIHDNWALADQFADNPELDGRKGVFQERYKMAAVLLYTSQGPIVTHGGVEIMRSKASAELKETVKETNEGLKVFLHGKRDTYNMRTPNQFEWENVGKTPKQTGNALDYKNMQSYWAGLNELRLSKYGEVFRNANRIPENYYQFIAPQDALHALGYVVDGKVLVLLNSADEPFTFSNVTFPDGKWRLVGNIDEINLKKGVKDENRSIRSLKGGKSYDIPLSKTDVKIWVKD